MLSENFIIYREHTLVIVQFRVQYDPYLRVSYILPAYLTSHWAGEIHAKYEKRGKHWLYCTRQTFNN